jgi:hypothetical protein
MGHSLPVPLSQLNVQWLDWLWVDAGRTGCGIEFDCPHCGQNIKVFFKNPLDGGPPRGPTDYPHWDVVSGKTLDRLTLHPSIRLDGHFHVHIKDGVLHQAT